MASSFLNALEAFAYRSKNRLVNFFDRPVVVLLYHRVATLQSDPQLLAVSPDNFRAHLQFLKQKYTLVRFEEDWSNVRKPAIAITFDDGYADNVRLALPILEETGVPATFFVTSGSIGSQQEFWWDELEKLILDEHDFPDTLELEDRDFGKCWPSASSADRQVLFEELQPVMRNADGQRRESLLRQLRQWAGEGKNSGDDHRAMTLEELQRLARSRWATVGAHTVTHSKLSCLALEEQQQEIIGSKMQLESWLGREVSVFSYPFGTREDYTQETVDLCRKAGFTKVAANFPAQIHSWTDLFQVPRQLVRNWPVEMFAEHLNKFWVS
jgi:peptidoglycan/xylan/chitin deacetylase (PgdA/CDA1 family)